MRKKILFADDDEDIRLVVKLLLEQCGYEVQVKENDDFLQQINASEVPDMFLPDKDINGIDGLDICTKLKTNPATKHIPVVMLSADPFIKEFYKNAGADGYIEKPFERTILISEISSYIR
jgi:two-component system, OmpR family, phosphate regulon response regulator PhoB